MSVKALVLGATGHIGNAIVRELLSRGYKVTAAARHSRPPVNLAGLAVNYCSGNHDEPDQLDAWVTQHDVVIDAAAPYPVHLIPKAPALLRAIRRARRLIIAVKRHGAQLVYISSFTTLKRWEGRIEEWPAQLITYLHPYFTLKKAIESELLEAADRGLPLIVVNPTMCLGPWDIRERDMCFIPRLLCGEIPAASQHMLNVIDVRDVARAAVAMMESQNCGAPTLLSGHNIPLHALFSMIAETAGSRVSVLSIPAGIGAFGSYLAELMLTGAGLRTPLVSLAPMLIYEHEWLPPCKAFLELGISVRPLYETVSDSLRWYYRIGYC
jgi:dihydroflavonol-4-reductase